MKPGDPHGSVPAAQDDFIGVLVFLHPTTQLPKAVAREERFLTVLGRVLTVFAASIIGIVDFGVTSLVAQILSNGDSGNSPIFVAMSIVVSVIIWILFLLMIAVAIAMFRPAHTDS